MSSVARVSEIIARSETSFEDAIQAGVARANETLRNVTGVWIKEQEIDLRDGSITAYKVKMHVTFVLD